jgi:hypothetical protein
MNKPSSRRPPSSRPSARRSLVELTAAASRAAEEGLPVAPLAPAATAVGAPVALPEAASQSCDLSSVDGTAALAVKAVKELQDTALEDFKVGMNAVLDHARDVVDTRKPSADHVARLEDPVAAGVGAAERYRAESLELARASLETAIDHARGLIRARTLAECVELSGKLARKQCAFAIRQAGAFKSFARAAAQSDPS